MRTSLLAAIRSHPTLSDRAREEETQRAKEKSAKKSAQNNLLHFYKNHQRELKQERLIALREKFEQDKLLINKMRQERKFKPY